MLFRSVCRQRTYDGEPAMKLEPLLAKGKLIDGFETETVNGCVKTAHLFDSLEGRKSDVAYSVVYSIMKELVDSAVLSAESEGLKGIGLTGGVSYNGTISRMFVDMVKSQGMEPLLHREVPNGDGGVSVGQAAIAVNRL